MLSKQSHRLARSQKKNTARVGLRVRSNVRAGAWKCRDCSGKPVQGGLYKADCGYCTK